jgi:hypothetical protein
MPRLQEHNDMFCNMRKDFRFKMDLMGFASFMDDYTTFAVSRSALVGPLVYAMNYWPCFASRGLSTIPAEERDRA